MSQLEADFLAKLGDDWEPATPGFCIQAFHHGKKIVDIEVGETFPLYDWASLTKIVFTTTAFMLRHDEKRFGLNDPISRWVEWFPRDDGHRMRDLLSHSAGMTWWYPFYKSIVQKTTAKTAPEEAWVIFQNILKRKVLSDLKKSAGSKSHTPARSVYSDLDFFMLGIALEAISESSLYSVWSEVRERMGLDDTDFHRGNRPYSAKKLYAPTEKEKWRGKTLQGEVHDQNTWSLKGVAPHAGLFGPIDDLSRYGLLLRAAMRGEKKRGFASPETVRLFTKRAIPASRGDWALGFMMPSPGSASCGPLFSKTSVGHTGFTGTSLWYDPKEDLLIAILSNRVHPTSKNKSFQQLRPRLHTLIAEAL